MSQTLDKDVVVIGAGISGLVCAYRLKSLGIDCVALDASDHPGGVIKTDRIDDYLIERGPNSSQGSEELLALIDEIGLTEELVEGDPKAPAYVFSGNRLHQVPGGPGAFFQSKLLSLSAKLRLLSEPFIRRRQGDGEESVFSFAERRLGAEVARKLVAPFVAGIYAGDSSRISLQAAFPKLAALEKSYGSLIRGAITTAKQSRSKKKTDPADGQRRRRRLISFREGMESLPRALGEKIGEDLLTGCSKIRLKRSGSSIVVDFTQSNYEYTAAPRIVVVSTPSAIAATILEPVIPEIGPLLSEIDYPRLAIVYLSYDTASIDHSLNGFGFLVAPEENLSILGCVWNSSLFPNRAPAGKSLFTVFMGGALRPEICEVPDGDLTAAAHTDLQRVLGIRGEPRVVAITRYERSIPQYNLGHAARVSKIDSLLAGYPDLRLIGNYLHGVSTGDCVRNADQAAREIATSLSKK